MQMSRTRHLTLTLVAAYLLAPATSFAQKCDANTDGKITTSDALIVLRASVGQGDALSECTGSSTTTTTTTTTTIPPPPNRYFERPYSADDSYFDGTGVVKVDATSLTKIVFKVKVNSGSAFVCGGETPAALKQGAKQWAIDDLCDSNNCVKIHFTQISDNCGDVYAGITTVGTISQYPTGFNPANAFRIILGVFYDHDYFDVGAM